MFVSPPPPRVGGSGGSRRSLTSGGSTARLRTALAALVLASAAVASSPAAAQTITVSASGNNGDRDAVWPGLQINEGDQVRFTFQLNNVPIGTSGLVNVNTTWSGTAYNVADLRTTAGTTLSPFNLPTSNIRSVPLAGNNRSSVSYLVAADGTAEGDETIAVTLVSMHASSVAGFTIGTPSSATVTIRGTDSAPSFGMGSVTSRTYVASSPIDEFQVPAASGGNGTIVYTASGLPAGLVFDATGTDTNGCPGTEAREVCGTPTAIGGPTTVTVTARDSDSNLGAGDRATLTFTITVSSDAPPSFGSGSVPEKAFILNTAIADFQAPAASGGNGTITYAASGLPTGLVFDATGSDTPGCTGSEAREICGTPSVAGSGTITITADDADTNMAPADRATLSFAYSVAADTAPTFGMASVSAKTFPAGAAITEFAVPAASGGNGTLSYAAANLPSGLVFDATGMDTPGCPGTEAREVCGTPDAATSGAVTVTITATDLDANTAPTDRAALTFTVTVTAGASLASSPSPLAEANLHGAELTVTLIGVTYASGVSASSFQLATAPTIPGLSIASMSGGAAGTAVATLTLATGAGYDVDAATLAVTVLAAAHSGAGDVASGSLPVTPTAPAVVVSRTSLSLDEDPGADDANQGTYTLVLDTRPTGCTAGVGVSVASGNPDVTPEPTALTFTPDDWNAPQTVTVTAEQDDDGIDDRATLRHTVTAACASAGYPATLAIPSVEVTVNDDDAPPPAGDVPTEVRAEATATGLLVTWTAAAGATSYKVQWRLSGQEWSSSRQEETTATRLELDLEPGGYEVRVVAVADGRDRAASAAAAGEVSEPVNAPPRLAEERPSRTRTATSCATRRPRTAPPSRFAQLPAGCASAASARARRRSRSRRPIPRAWAPRRRSTSRSAPCCRCPATPRRRRAAGSS